MKKVLNKSVLAMFFLCNCSSMHAQDIQDATMLEWLYGNAVGKVVGSIATSSSLWSKVVGVYAGSFLSKSSIKSFIEKYHVDMSDALIQDISKYKSLNDFFIRKLKPGARRFDQSDVLCSPADSRLLVIDNAFDSVEFPIKGTKVSIENMVADPYITTRFNGGTIFVFRLSPQDYHRFHMPLDGYLSAAKKLGTRYDSVSPTAYQMGKQPLEHNERHLIMGTTKQGPQFIIMPVGALSVGKIKELFEPDTFLKKGDEIGYFLFGGSTVVLIFPPKMLKVRADILDNSSKGIETVVRAGDRVADLN
ncbi:MAG: Phosphatidylserine decarboxylase proenzyme [candidate division TM6 bacterium GW2011_GWE2_41_16]|nr:MAG: Phosphatidylserine decarboxylase proenzyme [candidate division TM6 bacterium GW2011_GWE2_41_16]